MDSQRFQKWRFELLRAALGSALIALMPSQALGDEQTIRRALEPKLGGAKIMSIQKLPGVALYEVAILREGGHAIFYTDASAQYVINGSGKIAVLSDPNCPYCKRFEEDLARLDDITVHILPYAIIRPESVRQSKAVWCSAERVKAWNDLMFRRVEPQAGTDCDTPVEKLIEYGRRLGATATPTWFLANGERHSGALPLEQLRRLLDEASSAKR